MAGKSAKPIELYYWPTPNGYKIAIMLEECGLAYNVKYVDLVAGEQFKKSFLKIAPNNRMPAIIDPDGPGAKPISVFESGAILQYLGNKTAKFYPKRVRDRVNVEQWLFWQMGGLGPMAGQAHHFRQYAPPKVPYAIKRYTNECNRLYGVMNTQLKNNEFLAGKYSIADMACVCWIKPHKRQGQSFDDFKYLKRWFDDVMVRPAVQRAYKLGEDKRGDPKSFRTDKKAQAMLFGQTAR